MPHDHHRGQPDARGVGLRPAVPTCSPCGSAGGCSTRWALRVGCTTDRPGTARRRLVRCLTCTLALHHVAGRPGAGGRGALAGAEARWTAARRRARRPATGAAVAARSRRPGRPRAVALWLLLAPHPLYGVPTSGRWRSGRGEHAIEIRAGHLHRCCRSFTLPRHVTDAVDDGLVVENGHGRDLLETKSRRRARMIRGDERCDRVSPGGRPTRRGEASAGTGRRRRRAGHGRGRAA